MSRPSTLEPVKRFGGVPQSILYDNTRLAVAKIMTSGRRMGSKTFAELQSHYPFDDRWAGRAYDHP